MKSLKLMAMLIIAIGFTSCVSTHKTIYNGVGYRSVRTTVHKEDIPDDSSIITIFKINEGGGLTVIVSNQTDEIMLIDQTRSFLVDTDGVSQSYYDPTVRTQTVTDMSQQTQGASVNLGAVSSLLGVKGKVGGLLNGINVGGSTTTGSAMSTTTYFADQPQIALGPHGTGAMSKNFLIKNISGQNLKYTTLTDERYTSKNSPLKFSVCISYSLDDGETYNKIVTDFYVNSQIYIPVSSQSEVNTALRAILSRKSDAVTEPWGVFYFYSTADRCLKDYQTGKLFVNCQ